MKLTSLDYVRMIWTGESTTPSWLFHIVHNKHLSFLSHNEPQEKKSVQGLGQEKKISLYL